MFEILMILLIRVSIGVVAGGAAALVGYFIGWFFLLQPWMSSTFSFVVLVVSTGIFGGLGALSGWVRLDEGVRRNLPGLWMTLIGGSVGTWAGLLYAQAVFDIPIPSSDGYVTAIASAGIAANLLPLIFFGLREFRRQLALRD